MPAIGQMGGDDRMNEKGWLTMLTKIPPRLTRTSRVAVVVAVLMFTGLLGALPAAADESEELHCVVEVIDVIDGEMITGPPVCAGTPGAAMQRANPTVWRAPADARTGGETIERPMVLSVTLARHYDGSNGTGNSITIVGLTCNGSYWNTPSWWDNRISSTYNYCYRTRHYDNPNLHGASALYTGAYRLHNVNGYLNNRTESVKYYSS